MTLNVKEVATQLSVTEETVYRWYRAGELGYKLGNSIHVKDNCLKGYINKLYTHRQ